MSFVFRESHCMRLDAKQNSLSTNETNLVFCYIGTKIIDFGSFSMKSTFFKGHLSCEISFENSSGSSVRKNEL